MNEFNFLAQRPPRMPRWNTYAIDWKDGSKRVCPHGRSVSKDLHECKCCAHSGKVEQAHFSSGDGEKLIFNLPIPLRVRPRTFEELFRGHMKQ